MSLGRAFRTLLASVRQISGNLFVTFLANLVAMFLCIPLLVAVTAGAYSLRTFTLVPLAVVVLIGVLPNPFITGVQYVVREIAHGESIYVRDQWEGLKRYFLLALKCWFVSLLVTGVILLNVTFYAHVTTPARLVQALWISVLPLWFGIHLYVFPLLMEQEVKRVYLFYRNALIMTVFRPTYTLLVGAAWFAVLFFSSATGLVTVLGLALAASIQQNATAAMLETFDHHSVEDRVTR